MGGWIDRYDRYRKVPVLRTVTMKFLLMAKISENPDIPVTTHLRLPNLCINNSNRYDIDK